MRNVFILCASLLGGFGCYGGSTLPSGQAALQACRLAAVDTAGWRQHSSAEFGMVFRAPPRFERKIWAVRSDTTSDTQYWRAYGSLARTFEIGTNVPGRRPSPEGALSHHECVEARSGHPAHVTLRRASLMFYNGQHLVPYTVMAEWPLPHGRVLRLSGVSTDSIGQMEMLRIVQSARFLSNRILR